MNYKQGFIRLGMVFTILYTLFMVANSHIYALDQGLKYYTPSIKVDLTTTNNKSYKVGKSKVINECPNSASYYTYYRYVDTNHNPFGQLTGYTLCADVPVSKQDLNAYFQISSDDMEWVNVNQSERKSDYEMQKEELIKKIDQRYWSDFFDNVFNLSAIALIALSGILAIYLALRYIARGFKQ